MDNCDISNDIQNVNEIILESASQHFGQTKEIKVIREAKTALRNTKLSKHV